MYIKASSNPLFRCSAHHQTLALPSSPLPYILPSSTIETTLTRQQDVHFIYWRRLRWQCCQHVRLALRAIHLRPDARLVDSSNQGFILALHLSIKIPAFHLTNTWCRSGGSNKRQAPRVAGSHAAIRVPDDPSYNMNRFLQGSGERPPPGFGQALSKAEAGQRMQQMLHAFGAQFSRGGSSAAGRG